MNILTHNMNTGELRVCSRKNEALLFDGKIPDYYLARDVSEAIRAAELDGYRHGLNAAHTAIKNIDRGL